MIPSTPFKEFDDHLANKTQIGSVSHTNLGLDAIAWVWIGIVDHLVITDAGIRHDHQPVVECADARAAQADGDHIPPGVQFLDFDAIAGAEWLVEQDDQAADHVGKGVLCSQ